MKIVCNYEIKPATKGSAGLDLRANIPEDITLHVGEEHLIPTGVYAAIPEGWVGILLPRSSSGRKKIRLANTVGVIDSDYRDQIYIAVRNNNLEASPVIIEAQERLAQLLIIPHYDYSQIEYVDSLDNTERGLGGFGSTGTK